MIQPRIGRRAVLILAVILITVGVTLQSYRSEPGTVFTKTNETSRPTIGDGAESKRSTSLTGDVSDSARATVQRREVDTAVDSALFEGTLRVIVTDHRGRAVDGATIWTVPQTATSLPRRQDLDSE